MLDLPSYGYVLLTVVLTYFLLFWQGFMVGQKRKLYKVDYPAMYSDTEPMFNCYQRVHQNTLERVPIFLALLLAAGLFNAKMAAAFGFIWLVGRVIYSIGYYSGKPNNRLAGSLVTDNEIRRLRQSCSSLQIGLAGAELPLVIMTFLQCGQFAKWWDIPQAF